MSRYIDADVLIDDLIHNRSFYPALVSSAIKNTPTADVVEVRHGYWIRESFIDKHGEKMFTSPKCSLCDNIETFRSKYCPNCGAKMKGE